MLDVEHLNDQEFNLIAAALEVAVKGKLCMHCPCPKCGLAKRLFEKVYTDGSIRHECKSCGYLMFWKPRRKSGHYQPPFTGMKPYVQKDFVA